MGAWDEYDRWNRAVADIVFPEVPDAVPVYLDLETDTLAAIASSAAHQGDPREGLQAAVRSVTVSSSRFSLSGLLGRERLWRRRDDVALAPPSLAFLAATTLAAEDMGSSGDGLDPNNYYSRLALLLGLRADDPTLRQQYQRYSESLWGDLNRWLEALEGQRGLPTAYALSFRYVGLPLSQALVREGDRKKLPLFFAQFGLAAGMDLAPEVLERYLDSWFGAETCPASVALKKLWARSKARERIATVAAVELLGWDGTLPEGHAGQALTYQRVGIMAQVLQGFMGSRIDLSLTLRGLDADFQGAMEVEDASGQWLPLDFVPVVGSVWRTNFQSTLDIGSAIDGVVRLRPAGSSDAAALVQRHPRPLVPLVFDEMQGLFVEQERLQLNVDSLLLVRRNARGKPFAAEVERVLASCARPGFVVHEAMAGIPGDWLLFSGVQLFCTPANSRFNELVPLARDQLTLAGGLRIPSRVRKWSTLAPPEIRAAVESAESLRLRLTRVDMTAGDDEQEQTVGDWTSEGGALVVDLRQEGLPTGDYSAELFSGNSRTPVQRTTIRLRSADQVDPGWHLTTRLVYQLDQSATGALSATPYEAGAELERFVDGALASGWNDAAVRPAPHRPTWRVRTAETPPPLTVKVGSPEEHSCVATGAHHFVFPTFYGGWQPKFIEGVCKYCGQVKRTPGWISNRPRHFRTGSVAQVDVALLPPVEERHGRNWDAALDALVHLGGGSGKSLEALATQLDGSSAFSATFATHLESLGHLALERDTDGRPIRWEISPAQLVVSPEGVDLVGAWTPAAVQALAESMQSTATYSVVPSAEGPMRRILKGFDLTLLRQAAPDDVTLVETAADDVMAALPSLSDVAVAVAREPLPGFTEAEWFDLESAAWLRTNDVDRPGAFRFSRGFETMYAFRSPDDVAAGTVARGSVYLVKHLAANAVGSTLAFYLASADGLIVPRGCELPGLYQRAAVLASGKLPTHRKLRMGDVHRNCVVYGALAESQADYVCTLLSS